MSLKRRLDICLEEWPMVICDSKKKTGYRSGGVANGGV